jgi:hypothetical protein
VRDSSRHIDYRAGFYQVIDAIDFNHAATHEHKIDLILSVYRLWLVPGYSAKTIYPENVTLGPVSVVRWGRRPRSRPSQRFRNLRYRWR